MRDQPRVESGTPRGLDVTVPHPARMWNHWLGGKDHFAADRATAELVTQALPTIRVIARATRRLVEETVQRSATGGVLQFLDIGTGLPVADATHQVAQRVVPEARVVYVDNDPVVISHAQALLTGTSVGKIGYAELDLRDTDAVLARASNTLDFSQPVVVLLASVLHFIPDADDPWAIVRRLTGAMAPGSFLVIAHAASDIQPQAVQAAAAAYNERAAMPITPRDRDQVTRFFDGLALTGRGMAPAGRWWQVGLGDGPLSAYFGLARKP